NPTCCGVVPPLSALFQIATGSSNVYIGGARAARSGIDITMHCFNVGSPSKTVKIGKLAGLAAKGGKVANKVTGGAGKAARAVGWWQGCWYLRQCGTCAPVRVLVRGGGGERRGREGARDRPVVRDVACPAPRRRPPPRQDKADRHGPADDPAGRHAGDVPRRL